MATVDRLRRRVVVVGAGAVGLAAALQLARAGVSNVIVVDRLGAPGMGSTSRANGGVRAQFSTAINVEFSRFTIAGLLDLHDRTDGLVGLRQVGYLFMAGTEAAEAALRENWELQRSLGLGVDWLTPAEVLARAPFVRADGLRGGTFCATDGIIDPHGVASALAQVGRAAGVEYVFGQEVVAVDVRGASLVVRTPNLDIVAEHVVNAAGPLARELAAMAGVDLPVRPYRRNLACTQPVAGYPDRIPMCVDLDTGVLIRREGGGFLLAYSDPNDSPTTETAFDPRFLEDVARRIGHRFPFLESVPIDERNCWAGLYPETPDHQAIIGPAGQLSAFIQCAGFGGHGIMHSLAAGQAVAELVRDGTCRSFDLHQLRPSRFEEGDLTVEAAVL
jgi:sarcosine oxidase, subunit beta